MVKVTDKARSRIILKRIDHDCKGGIENSFPSITVLHHEACRVMTNSDPEGHCFSNPTLTQSIDFFLCSLLNFYFDDVTLTKQS